MKKKVRLKTFDDIKRIKEAGWIISEIFRAIAKLSLSGFSTLELDGFVEDIIHKSKARPSFKTVKNYNYATCISVNSEAVHGIPSKKNIIKNGDLVKIDIGTVKNGYFADACHTFEVPEVTSNAARLVSVARDSLYCGIELLQPGKRLGDAGAAIQEFTESRGFSIVKDFSGHGVGYAVHEPPNVPHFGIKGRGGIIQEGMVLAVEPIVNEGIYEVKMLENGWTAVTADGKLSAQFEHTVAVTKDGPVILTD